jgi:hypothetical protein
MLCNFTNSVGSWPLLILVAHSSALRLGLELPDTGCDPAVLSAFRTRLVQHGAVTQLFEGFLPQFQGLGLLKAHGQQRTDSTHVRTAMSTLNRLERVGEAMRAALTGLAEAAPASWRMQMPHAHQATRLWGSPVA